MQKTAGVARGRLGRAMSGLKSRVVSLRGAVAAAGTYGFGRFVLSTLKAHNALRSAENGFLRLARTKGIPDARKQLQRFNDQLDGMADRATVASLASRLMATNSNLNADAVAKVLRYSRDWADTTGQELLPVIQSLSSALGGMELETIRRLGLEVDFATALKEKAKALRKSAAALTEEEKRAAKTAVVLDAIARKHKEIGRTGITAANNVSRLSASWTDFKAGIGEGFGEMLGPSLQALADIMHGRKPVGQALSEAARENWTLMQELVEGATGADLGADDQRLQIERRKRGLSYTTEEVPQASFFRGLPMPGTRVEVIKVRHQSTRAKGGA
jgi:hypothetical protein